MTDRNHRTRRGRYAQAGRLASLAALLMAPLAAPALAKDGTIKFARGMDVNTLDPQSGPIAIASQVIRQIFDPLLALDADGKIQPVLAESWNVSDDLLSYRFKIRQGLSCHDGTPFNAEAVKWNFLRMARPETVGAASLKTLDSVTADGDTVEVKFKTPDAAFPTNLGGIRFGFMCPSSVAADGAYKPVGTGPWKFVSWERNVRIRLERNDAFVNHDSMVKNPGSAHEKFLEFVVIPEAVARMAAFRRGEINFVEPALEEVANLKNDKKFKLWVSEYSGQYGWGTFTLQVPELKDERVRKAIIHAINRKAIAEIAFEGLGRPIECPGAPTATGVDEAACAKWGQAYDPAQARKLLAEAGFSRSKPLQLTLSVHQLIGWDLMHQIMLQNFKDVGIDATLETRDAASFMENIKKENLRTAGRPVTWTWGASALDLLSGYASSFSGQGYLNAGLGAEFDKVIGNSKVLTGGDRIKATQQVMKFMLTNALIYPLMSPGWAFFSASPANVDGFRYGIEGNLHFTDVKL